MNTFIKAERNTETSATTPTIVVRASPISSRHAKPNPEYTMKAKFPRSFIVPALLALGVFISQPSPAQAQSTAFTYQGQLSSDAVSASGSFDLTFALFNARTGGSQVGSTVTNLAVGVASGLFTVTIDFGAVFDGAPFWLQIGVRTNGADAFTPLKPRQELTPTPYALYSPNAGTAVSASAVATGSVSSASIQMGTITGSNLNLGSVSNALGGSFWTLGGNAGTVPGVNFLGTTDNQPLQLRSGNEPGLQLQSVSASLGASSSSSMNLVGGYWGNTVLSNAIGATIAGGGVAGRLGTYRYTSPNTVNGNYGTVSGGYGNTAGLDAVVPGGYNNTATGDGSLAAGRNAQTVNAGSFIWGDGSKAFSSSGVNCFDVLATGGVFFNTGPAGFNLDQLGLNNGTTDYGLRFGVNSGEGIGSKRTSGGNVDGLDFYTSWTPRLSISNGGSVGIGTTAPSGALLEVNGDLRIDNNRLLLAPGLDTGNGLAYATSGLFGVPGGAGPLLFGYNGGSLGTVNPTSIALSWTWAGNVWVSNNLSTAGLNIDQGGYNVGNVRSNALTFGISSGEGVASKRSGANPYDLEFFTDFINRMTISQAGNVGIGTTTPNETLEINGASRIDDHDMYFRAGTDQNHGIVYRATAGGLSIDGPFIYGWTGGALGGKNPETVALKWDWQGNIWVSNNVSTATLTIRGGADVAEPFPVTGSQVEPGTVMVIDEANPGHLARSAEAYDTRVAGIISGAGGINPGLSLQQDGVLDQGQKVALSGRVYVKADASQGRIKPGDLLTTSALPGCAMRVGDHVRAQGAILGKAMTGLEEGQGLVLVLVTLQ